MKYGLLALLALAIIPGCSCLRKDSGKKKEKKIRAPKRIAVEQMPSVPMDGMAMQPEIAIDEIDIMPDMMKMNDGLTMAEEPMSIEPMEMPVQEDMMPEIMEMEKENIQF